MAKGHLNFNCLDLGYGGGNRVILELASRLSKRGFDISVTAICPEQSFNWFGGDLRRVHFRFFHPSKFQILLQRKILRRNYFFVRAKLLEKVIPDSSLNVATSCFTAEPTALASRSRSFYLVQNYEPWFYTDTALKEKAELSYDLPLTKLCVSDWLSRKVNGTNIGSGINTEVFHPYNKFEEKEPNSVLYLYRRISWKRDDLAMKTLGRLYKNKPDVKIHIVGDPLTKPSFPCTLHPALTDIELAKLYSKCRVLLYASKFEGKGLPPLEALACGTNVATTPFYGNDYLVYGENCLGYSLKDIEQFFKNDDLSKDQIKRGKVTVRRHSYEQMIDNFVRSIGN